MVYCGGYFGWGFGVDEFIVGVDCGMLQFVDDVVVI